MRTYFYTYFRKEIADCLLKCLGDKETYICNQTSELLKSIGWSFFSLCTQFIWMAFIFGHSGIGNLMPPMTSRSDLSSFYKMNFIMFAEIKSVVKRKTYVKLYHSDEERL